MKNEESIGKEASELSTRHITKSCWLVEEDNGMEERDRRSSVMRNMFAFVIPAKAIFFCLFADKVLALCLMSFMYMCWVLYRQMRVVLHVKLML